MKFEECLKYNLEAYYNKGINEASTKEIYNSLVRVVMSKVSKEWKKSKESYTKRCGYLSAEFLIGRLVYANLLNLDLLDEAKEVLSKNNLDINMFEDVEDAALGNGGLGRLAACFLESAATKEVPLDGYGLRYRFGLFKQSFVEGFQNENADDWLKWGDPFSVCEEQDTRIVEFKDFKVKAVPYDMPVIGYKSKCINTLRLWSSEPLEKFNFKAFDDMHGEEIAINSFMATEITDVLYPNDNTRDGKILRLRQEYFMVSASLQDVLAKYKATNRPWACFSKYQIFQLNDTHPVLAIPELIRLLMIEGLSFDDALKIAKDTFNFTNHTVMQEALEKWPVDMLEQIIPNILKIIYKIQEDLESNLDSSKYYIIKDNLAHMADLAIYVGGKVNGVAKIHSNILINDTFKDWYSIYPEKFVNVTNGITPRRWIALNNPKLRDSITELIGEGWIKDLTLLNKLGDKVHTDEFLDQFRSIRLENKQILSDYIYKHEGVRIPTNFIFDIQIKRLHEYKRQLMNALSILYLYYELKDHNLNNFKPTAFIFGAKSAPGYYMAKAIIKFINTIADLINNDEEVNDKLKVVFVQNYNVSYAERLVCAADISEQISTAGLEASGTGNMKFMLNGTPTLGTLDGANVEICQEAGPNNNYIFGATVDEVAKIKQNYNPSLILDENPKLKRVVESLVDGSLSDGDTGVFSAIYHNLLSGNNPDNYLVIADLNSYIEAKLQSNNEYDTKLYYNKCTTNMQSCAKFSSDRSILDYNELIWKLI